jgi:hypothetical protein
MTRLRPWHAALAQALLVALLAPAFGDDAETKQARKELKKNGKKLAAIEAAIAKTDAKLDLISAAPKADEAGRTAAESELGELRAQAGEVLAAIAKADDEDAAELLLQYGQTCADPVVHERALGELSRLTSDGAVSALAAVLGSDVVDDGKKKKKPQPWQAQVLVARAFESIEHAATIPPIAAQIEKGTVPAVVNQCVKTAGKKPDKRVVPALIALLGRVEGAGGHEYYRVRQALVDLTGQDYFTREKWDTWWKTNEATFDFSKKGDAREAATRERGAAEKVPTFFGSEIASNRICFVIDTSGSMEMTDRPAESAFGSDDELAKKNPDDPDIRALQRINRAKSQLTQCVGVLLPTQRFNIIAFSGGTRMWKPSVVDGTEANKADALKFVEGMRADGGTNTHAALELALQDPAVDTIYLLSDGAPMIKVGNPGEQMKLFAKDEIRKILEFVDRANRFRGVRIDTFGMDGPGVWHTKNGPRPPTLPTEPDYLGILSGFLRELASRNGGQFKSI